ncbi:hypothetical protein B5S28_g3780 [[Candida] boidinii]|nr:hypothetical protein B5S28_g3780 [[Candida] boidinii]OWB60367.1 hypothetical protein B5S29_g1241 [[Candida] boidinii]
MSTDKTSITLPSNLPFPITISKIHIREGETIKKHTTLISYRFLDFEPIPISEEVNQDIDESERKLRKVEHVSSFECPLEGEILKINVKLGDKIKDSNFIIAEILEPCSHSIQYGGLCAICGKPIEDIDYSGFNDKDRAPINMNHSTTNLKVSAKEAANIEKSSTQRLLKEEKLSLVVDLDQTVIHATVDPTVGEWMSDKSNPNYKSVKNVRSFSLEEEIILPPNYTGPKPPPNLRWYYVKLRPGLEEFLAKISQLYELHIYTMATRAYAKSIAKIIDPDGKYFGERILSRDESGSLTQKSLKRLFPVDTSMVTIIDDRGDVWDWSPNLIKVVPYDFFVGIGDINSSFLPRQHSLLGPSKRRKSVASLEDKINAAKDSLTNSSLSPLSSLITDKDEIEGEIDPNEEAIVTSDDSVPPESPSTSNNETKTKEDDVSMISVDEAQDQAGENEAKKEDDVGAEEEEAGDISFIQGDEDAMNISQTNEEENENINQNGGSDVKTEDISDATVAPLVEVASIGTSPVDRMMKLADGDDNTDLLIAQSNERSEALEQQETERPLAKLQENLDKIIEEEESHPSNNNKEFENEEHNLLSDDDTELTTLGQALVRIHNEFYIEVENSTSKLPDIKDIMNSMKQFVFQNCVFLLSGILPIGTPLENADIVIWAKSFGATFVNSYNTSVTHVICKNPGTFKVRLAKTLNPKVHVVNPDWLFGCISYWERVSEEDYTIEVPEKSLLSKQEAEDYKRTHSIDDGDFANADLDWDEIDVEIKEFMGSDYDDDEDEDDDDDDDDEQEDNNENNGSTADAHNDDDNSKKRKVDDEEEGYDESGEFNTSKMVKLDTSANGDSADGEADSSAAADGESSDEEFERELLQELEENSEDEITSTPIP